MVQLAVWLFVCFVLAGTLHDKPMFLALVALVISALVPGIAGHLVTGVGQGSYAFQPASWLIIAALLVQVFRHPMRLFDEIARRPVTYVLLAAVVIAALIITRAGSASGGSVLIVDQIFAPVGMFCLILVTSDRQTDVVIVRNLVLGLALVESVLAIAQWLSTSVLVFAPQYEAQYWFHPETWNRWMGTTDHPLVLSMLLCAAVPLVAGYKRPVVQAGLITIFSLSTVITQSRTAAVLVPVGILYVLARSRSSVVAKSLLAGLVCLGTFLLLQSSVIEDLRNRFLDDTGSAAARSSAWQFFGDHWSRFFYYGDGITSSYDVARNGGLGTSLESAYLMYAVGIGVVATSIYFVVQTALAVSGLVGQRIPGARLAALMVLIVPETFSSLGVDTFCGPLLWVVLALIASRAAPPADANGRASGRPLVARSRDRVYVDDAAPATSS